MTVRRVNRDTASNSLSGQLIQRQSDSERSRSCGFLDPPASGFAGTEWPEFTRHASAQLAQLVQQLDFSDGQQQAAGEPSGSPSRPKGWRQTLAIFKKIRHAEYKSIATTFLSAGMAIVNPRGIGFGNAGESRQSFSAGRDILPERCLP